MAVKKPNLKSVRLSDKVVGYIEQAAGETFTEKLECFVLHAVEAEPELKRRLELLEQQAEKKRSEIETLSEKLYLTNDLLHHTLYVVTKLEELRWELDELSGRKNEEEKNDT